MPSLRTVRLWALLALAPACHCNDLPADAPTPLPTPGQVRVATDVLFKPASTCSGGYGTLVFSLRNNETQAEGFGCWLCPAADGSARFHFDEELQGASNPGPYRMAFNYNVIAGDLHHPADLLFAGSGHDQITYPPACGTPCVPPADRPPCGPAGVPPASIPTSAPASLPRSVLE